MAVSGLFTKNFTLCTVISFCYSVSFFLLYICMSNYSTEQFHASSAEAGFTASIFIFGGLIGRLIFGRYIDVIGRKKLLMIGLIISTFLSLLYFLVPTLILMYIVRLAHGLCYGICTLAINTVIADVVPANRRGEGMGYFMLSFSIASAVGPYLSIVLLQLGDYTTIFTLNLVVYVICTILALMMILPKVTLTSEQRSSISGFKLNSFIEKSALKISFVCLIFYFSYSGVLTFVAQYGTSIDLAGATSVFFIMIAISTLISRLFLLRIYDHRGENAIIIPSIVLFVVGMVILSMANTGVVLLLAGFLLGFGIAIVNTVGQSIVIRTAPKYRYGIALATFTSFNEVAYGIGPLFLGILITYYGYREMYLMMAGVAVLSLIMYIILHGMKMNKQSLDEIE
ncbi:MAG: MFS transporter [Candidatus Methanomethylophilaceae archaeon]|nr:MFS transporter [Candidatus Methanomethylophilaceae archaeon]MDY0223862.1 MFS transporter [Candidatus Methanomethylophilaceae archaeon]